MFLQKFMASKFLKGKPLHLTLCYNPYEVAKEKKGYGTQMDIWEIWSFVLNKV